MSRLRQGLEERGGEGPADQRRAVLDLVAQENGEGGALGDLDASLVVDQQQAAVGEVARELAVALLALEQGAVGG